MKRSYLFEKNFKEKEKFIKNLLNAKDKFSLQLKNDGAQK